MQSAYLKELRKEHMGMSKDDLDKVLNIPYVRYYYIIRKMIVMLIYGNDSEEKFKKAVEQVI